MSSSTNIFLKRENISLLWNIIIDEKIIKGQSSEILNKILTFFQSNIVIFYEREKNNCNSLVEINKKYIMFVLDHIKATFFNNNNNNNNNYNNVKSINKIKIHEDISKKNKELITFEELQKEKLSKFEQELSKKEEEFKMYTNKQVPPTPNFSDEMNDVPISEFNEIIKKITMERNYDIENISANNKNTNVEPSFLKSQSTSIKNEKLIQQEQVLSKKNISWGKNTINTIVENEINSENIQLIEKQEVNNNNINIFEKLKVNDERRLKIQDLPKIQEKIEIEDKFNKIQNDIININLKIDKLFDLIQK